MKNTIADLRNKWKLFYDRINDKGRRNIVIYILDNKNKKVNAPYSLYIIQIEIKAKTKLGTKMLKQLTKDGLI